MNQLYSLRFQSYQLNYPSSLSFAVTPSFWIKLITDKCDVALLFFRYRTLHNVATACSIPRFSNCGLLEPAAADSYGSQLATAGPATGKRFYCCTATFIMLLFNKKNKESAVFVWEKQVEA